MYRRCFIYLWRRSSWHFCFDQVLQDRKSYPSVYDTLLHHICSYLLQSPTRLNGHVLQPAILSDLRPQDFQRGLSKRPSAPQQVHSSISIAVRNILILFHIFENLVLQSSLILCFHFSLSGKDRNGKYCSMCGFNIGHLSGFISLRNATFGTMDWSEVLRWKISFPLTC